MSPEESGMTFGARLMRERELREIALEEISRVTKISIHLLRAMEDDEWDKLPGGIFTRNFIRLYAGHLGLDADRWVGDFKHYMQARKRAEGLEEDGEDEEGREKARFELPRGWLYTLLAVMALLLIGGYLGIAYLRQPPETGARPAEGAAESQAPQTPSSVQREGGQEGRTEKALRLVLKETDPQKRCWFKWWADGKLRGADEGITIPASQEVSLEADEKLRIHINHLDSVEVWLNGTKRSWDEFSIQEIMDEELGVRSYVVEITSDALIER